MPFCLVEWNHLCHFVRSRGPNKEHLGVITVNSEMRSFVKIKSSQNGEITLSFTDIDKSRIFREFSTSQLCVLTLFAKNTILTKISDFTVFKFVSGV